MRIGVIGCGIFGAMAAIRLADAGHDVAVFERENIPLAGASHKSTRRIHLGFHYPRDINTARQCILGFQRFRDAFRDCVVDVRPNAYFVASSGSRTSPEEYLRFADRLGVAYEVLNVADFRPVVQGVEVGISVPEAVYDWSKLRKEITHRLHDAGLFLGVEVTKIVRNSDGFVLSVQDGSAFEVDAVVNCIYADINRFGEALGHPCREYQYERTAIQVIEWDQPPVGITIMDGEFPTILPLGETGKFLLYHVKHSVLARTTGTQLPVTWRDERTAPIPDESFWDNMLADCRKFVPSLESTRPLEVLCTSRIVLANQDSTDKRPSIIQMPEPRFINVFAGKVDHCVWVADEVEFRLRDAA